MRSIPGCTAAWHVNLRTSTATMARDQLTKDGALAVVHAGSRRQRRHDTQSCPPGIAWRPVSSLRHPVVGNTQWLAMPPAMLR